LTVLALIEAGDPESAGAAASGPAPEAFQTLTAELTRVRGDAVHAIAQAAAEAGSVATASRFTVAFFVPTIGLAVGLVVVRRRRKREQLAVDLEKERAINRSKDQLIANLSHELRTPLTGIYTSALTIEDLGFEDIEVASELTSMIVDQSADLNRMVEDLLVSAQADAGRLSFDLRETDPVAEIEGVVKELRRFGTPVATHTLPAPVLADPGRLRQLLRNLLSNAIRHGGATVEVHGAPIGDSYVIRVEDDGAGVPDEIEGRIFERFVHQGDRPLIVGSVGLGLSITRVLAEGMGGAISYRRAGNRTTFELRLDLARPMDAGATEPAEPWRASKGLADDEEEQALDRSRR
jgi:signal transduction histidine kinase